MSAFARLRYKHSIVDLKTSSMKMSKMPVEGNSYFNVSRRTFIPHPVPCGAPTDAMNFAYAMCFGAGHHRAHRTGGLMMRLQVKCSAMLFRENWPKCVCIRFSPGAVSNAQFPISASTVKVCGMEATSRRAERISV